MELLPVGMRRLCELVGVPVAVLLAERVPESNASAALSLALALALSEAAASISTF